MDGITTAHVGVMRSVVTNSPGGYGEEVRVMTIQISVKRGSQTEVVTVEDGTAITGLLAMLGAQGHSARINGAQASEAAMVAANDEVELTYDAPKVG